MRRFTPAAPDPAAALPLAGTADVVALGMTRQSSEELQGYYS